jgi:hypothetical protein
MGYKGRDTSYLHSATVSIPVVDKPGAREETFH